MYNDFDVIHYYNCLVLHLIDFFKHLYNFIKLFEKNFKFKENCKIFVKKEQNDKVINKTNKKKQYLKGN